MHFVQAPVLLLQFTQLESFDEQAIHDVPVLELEYVPSVHAYQLLSPLGHT